MSALKSLRSWVESLFSILTDLLIPEDRKIQRLLALNRGVLRRLLPSSPVHNRDIVVLFDYGNKIVKLIIKSIKYKNNLNLKKLIAQHLYEEIIEIVAEVALFEGAPPILVPMPMSPIEKRKRGFNQCEELVKEIKKLGSDNIEVSYNALKKVRETERQTKLSREARLENVKNSQKVSDPSKIRDRIIIVLDDVYTVGATLSESRRALLASGARRVINLFIAH